MKIIPSFLTLLLGISIVSAEAEARGDGKRGGGGGGGRSAAPSRGGSSSKRSPMTGSKIERPAARPAPKPAAKPAARPEGKPASRPEAKPAQKPQRPSIQRPTTKPAPEGRPDRERPDRDRPEGKPAPGKPDRDRPDTKPAPGNPDRERPDTKPAPTRPGGNERPEGRPERPETKPTRPGGNERPETKPARPDGNERPEAKPARPGGNERPEAKPARPGGNERPETKPARPGGNERPETKPARPGGNERPETKPMPRPDRPNTNNRPSTLPGMVTYPNRPGGNHNNNRPGNNNGNRPNKGNGSGNGNFSGNNINNGTINTGNTYVTNVNKNRKNTQLNRPAYQNGRKRDWDNNQWGGNRGVWGNNNNVNIHVDNNFHYNNNYSYRPNYWGARPWWGASSSYNWHHGHWNYGYNSHYYHSHYYYNDDNDFASGFMWGIAVWSLGNMVYDMGYQSYRNPYTAPPVKYNDSKSAITYTQPVSVTAAAAPPGDEKTTELAESRSTVATETSRSAFKKGDYVIALKSADEAIAYTPGDVTLHEYRALVLFALARYSDAAGVLNPVLASGPGWGWETMVGFYDSSATYSGQLRKLEAYVKGTPSAADGRFLLGYHYLVCGHMEQAYEQFEKVTTLQPADSISRQLRDLTKSSLPDNGGADDAVAPEPPPAPEPIPSEKLVGTWTSDRGDAGKITFTMEESGDYTWSYVNGADSKLMRGTFGLNDKGLLVLSSDDSQMVSAVTLDGDNKMKFVLVGAPEGDPGIDFTKGS